MTLLDKSPSPAAVGVADLYARHPHTAVPALAVAALTAILLLALTLALAPSLVLLQRWGAPLWRSAHWWSAPALALTLAAAVLLSGVMLLLVVPLLDALLPMGLRASGAGHFSAAVIPRYLHNGLLCLARLTVLPFVSRTPLGAWFLRAMGMQVGRQVCIATANFSDVRMIELGDDAAICGSASILAHLGGGDPAIAPVVIGRRATVGEQATVMGDVIVGDEAVILAHAVLIPGSRVPPGERWGGAPARPIPDIEWAAYQALVRGPV